MNSAEWCEACRSAGHEVAACTNNPHKPPPAGARKTARVVVERRPSYAVDLGGGKRRRFATKGAAYYALAKRAIGVKYMRALAVAGHGHRCQRLTAEQAADETGLSVDAIKARAERAADLFVTCSIAREGELDGEYFDSDKWVAYVRRVAKKWRALDEYREAVRRG